MSLNPGARLGPYEIVAAAGAGGMGEVYRARDTRLERTVAIKVLPSHVATTPELRERFEREARTIASLNHPNICTLHDVGQHEGIDFLVMEYLEGETLGERLKRGALPIQQALEYAIQIADALDKAHRAGIVHRDLKPGNIFLTRSGGPSGPAIAKLLDFGLAKALPATGATSGSAGEGSVVALASALARASMMPTEASALTMEGTLLGTLQYMAPEQLEGRGADARTDIFAFGAVLYEMVTGQRAFQGKSQVSLMAAIIDQEPAPISVVQPIAPPILEHCVRTCLAKDPDARWQHAGDLLIQLKLIAERIGHGEPQSATVPASRSVPVAWTFAALAIVSAVALATLVVFGRGTAPEPAKIAFRIEVPSAPSPLHLSISPDGTRVAYPVTSANGPSVLWVRALEHLEAQVLLRTEGVAFPFWSPDGRAIAFFADSKLKKVDIFGAPPQTLCDAPNGHGGTWNTDGTIVFAPTASGPLSRVSAAGGPPAQVTRLDTAGGEIAHRHPSFLPDGNHFIYTVISGKPEQSAVYVGSLTSADRTRLVASTQKAVFAAPDHVLFMRDSTLMAQRFDVSSLELRGDPFPALTEEVGVNLANSAAGFSASTNGMLAYRAGGVVQRTMAWFDRSGKQTGMVGVPSSYRSPVISPEAQRVAAYNRDGSGEDIWIFDLTRGTSSRFTFDPGTDDAPIWSPDGTRVVFSSSRAGALDLYEKNAGGAGQETLLLKSDQSKLPDDWSRDGRFILYRAQGANGFDLWTLPLEGDRKPQPLLQTPFNEIQARFSPDGRWFAYVSNESGAFQVYVQNFPPSGSKWQISTAGGLQPRWRGDGKILFFVSNDQAMAVDITAEQGVLKAGVPQPLFRILLGSTVNERNAWDVTPDGQRFLVNTPTSQTGGQVTPITVVVNWLRTQNAEPRTAN